MKKLSNRREDIVMEEIKGFAAAYKRKIRHVENTHIIARRSAKEKGKVKLLMGNGAGHEPMVMGLVGKGMLDVNVPGEVFSAPSAENMLEAMEYVDDGSPILICIQNHAGDVMNGTLAMEMAREKGINAFSAVFYDDIASAPKEHAEERRGIGGMLFYAKIVGALSERGGSIDECLRVHKKCTLNTRTLGVAFTMCTHPVTGMVTMSVPEDEFEIGMGAHGEGGTNRIKQCSSKELAKIMCDMLAEDLPYEKGDEIIVLLNGAGGITAMELNIFYNDMSQYMEGEKGIGIYDGVIGEYLTTQELSGFTISLLKIDKELKDLWNDPSEAPCFTRENMHDCCD